MSEHICTCAFAEPRRYGTTARGPSGYAIYLDFIEDDTEFDPACPFHGEDGSMVALIGESGKGYLPRDERKEA